MTKVRVGVNLSFLRPDDVGGSEVFVRSMMTELHKIPEIEIVELGLPPGRAYTTRRRLMYDNRGIRKDLERGHIDVLWQPANVGSPLVRSSVAQVLTVHDLIHRRLGQLASQTPVKARDILMRASIRRAIAVTAVSETTKTDLVDLFGMERDSVVVIGEGVDVDVGQMDSRTEKWPYVVYPAMLSAHKNHSVLFHALRRLHDEGHMLGLILTGKSTVHEEDLRKQVAELDLTNWVEFRGFVSRPELIGLVSNAEALVYPSLYEGFGLPVVEAMALGTPTVTSEAPALVETSGGASVVVSAHDARAWARSIHEIVNNRSYKAELVRLGRLRAAEHSWARSAEVLAEVFSHAARSCQRT